jgi:hypothetical protein
MAGFLVVTTVLNREETLGILRGHAEQGGNPHPEQRARTAATTAVATRRVAGADGGGKGGAQCTEAGNLAVTVLLVLQHVTEGLAQLANCRPPTRIVRKMPPNKMRQISGMPKRGHQLIATGH